MRITISLEDRLAEQTRQKAKELGMSVSSFIAKTLGDALKQKPATMVKPFRLITVAGPGPARGVDLDRPRG